MTDIKKIEHNVFIVDRRETLVQSVAKDLFTFSFLALCIWLSHGDKFWTFLTGTMTICMGGASLARAVKRRVTKFSTFTEAAQWARAKASAEGESND